MALLYQYFSFRLVSARFRIIYHQALTRR